MDYRQANTIDLAKIFKKSAPRMFDEYERAGYNPRQAKDVFIQLIKIGRAHTLLSGDSPLAIIAWNIQDNSICTFFAANEEFFSAKYVRFCKSHILHIQSANQGLPVVSESLSTDPRTPKWFELLGFEMSHSNGTRTTYLLPSTKNK